MSINTAHASNGVLIHAGEYILLHSDNVTMEFSGQDNSVFKGSKHGRIYLTSHRVIFNNKKPGDSLQSFSAPFIMMSDVELEQPVFGANYIKGKVRAQPNGNFVGEVKFKLHFKSGGAIEYGQALLRAAGTAQSNMRNSNFSDDPPPYTPSGAWHEAPPPAYQPPPGYYGWLPTHDAFTGPAPNSVFVSDNPPPYPGIGGPPPYTPQQPQQYGTGTPSWGGFSAPPSDQQGQHHAPQAAGWVDTSAHQPPPFGISAPGYGTSGASGVGGFAHPNAPGYDAAQQRSGGFTQPGAQGAWSAGPNQCYPGGGHPCPPGSGPFTGAGGFNMHSANSKEAEAMASAYNTPYQQNNNPGGSDMPPPSYSDLPPNYNDVNRRN